MIIMKVMPRIIQYIKLLAGETIFTNHIERVIAIVHMIGATMNVLIGIGLINLPSRCSLFAFGHAKKSGKIILLKPKIPRTNPTMQMIINMIQFKLFHLQLRIMQKYTTFIIGFYTFSDFTFFKKHAGYE